MVVWARGQEERDAVAHAHARARHGAPPLAAPSDHAPPPRRRGRPEVTLDWPAKASRIKAWGIASIARTPKHPYVGTGRRLQMGRDQASQVGGRQRWVHWPARGSSGWWPPGPSAVGPGVGGGSRPVCCRPGAVVPCWHTDHTAWPHGVPWTSDASQAPGARPGGCRRSPRTRATPRHHAGAPSSWLQHHRSPPWPGWAQDHGGRLTLLAALGATRLAVWGLVLQGCEGRWGGGWCGRGCRLRASPGPPRDRGTRVARGGSSRTRPRRTAQAQGCRTRTSPGAPRHPSSGLTWSPHMHHQRSRGPEARAQGTPEQKRPGQARIVSTPRGTMRAPAVASPARDPHHGDPTSHGPPGHDATAQPTDSRGLAAQSPRAGGRGARQPLGSTPRCSAGLLPREPSRRYR